MITETLDEESKQRVEFAVNAILKKIKNSSELNDSNQIENENEECENIQDTIDPYDAETEKV